MPDPITLYECDVCEWAATTGAPWDRCPHCDTSVPPSRREVVYLSDAKYRAALEKIADVASKWGGNVWYERTARDALNGGTE